MSHTHGKLQPRISREASHGCKHSTDAGRLRHGASSVGALLRTLHSPQIGAQRRYGSVPGVRTREAGMSKSTVLGCGAVCRVGHKSAAPCSRQETLRRPMAHTVAAAECAPPDHSRHSARVLEGGRAVLPRGPHGDVHSQRRGAPDGADARKPRHEQYSVHNLRNAGLDNTARPRSPNSAATNGSPHCPRRPSWAVKTR